jgi:ferrous iron transport protein A
MIRSNLALRTALKCLKTGERGVITRLNPTNEVLLRKLTAMGLRPGTLIRLEQRSPRFIITLGKNRLALSDSMIHAIDVRLVDGRTELPFR